MKLFIFYVILIVSCILLSANVTFSQSSRIEIHPIEEKIPYWANDHLLVTKKTIPAYKQKYEFNSSVILGNKKPTMQLLDQIYGNIWSIKAVSINPNRLIILDKDNSKLIEYDIINRKSTVIATAGRGPGDLFFHAS